MTSALAWIAFPLAMLAIAHGTGLLAERVTRAELPVGLLAPVGASVCVLLALPVYLFDGTAPVAAVLLVVAAVVGVVLGRGRLRRPDWGAPALAALAAYGLFMAPVLLSGHWTWAGYNFVNDPAVNMVMVDHIAHHGDAETAFNRSTTGNMIVNTLGTAYPLGIHALLASLNWLVPLPLAAVYQPFIAMLAALAAMAFAELGRRCGLPRWIAAAAAVAAVGANLTYQYALHGAFKEIALVTMLATAAALARVALDARLHAGTVALVAITLAAATAVISIAAGAYAVVLGGLMLVAALWIERTRPSMPALRRSAIIGAGVLVVAITPFLRQAISFGRTASEGYSSAGTLGGENSTNVLGHLLRALPPYQGLGIWPRDDYRFPLEPGVAKTLTTVALVVVALLLVFGVVTEVRRRRLGASLAVVPAALVYAVAAPLLSPYAEAKPLVAAAPAAVFGAAIGAWWLWERLRPAGVAAALVLVLGLGVSNAVAYHEVRLAPTDRMEALEDAADHAGRGFVLYPEWEEFAKFFGRGALLNVASEAFSPLRAALREPGPLVARSLDLDEVEVSYVQKWAGVVLRRGPATSRPPASFSPTYRNADYEVWRRDPAVRVREHLPLASDASPGRIPACAEVTALARRAGPGERLVAAPAPQGPTLDPTRPPLKPLTWGVAPRPDVVIPNSPARVTGRLRFASGSYRVWIRGSAMRPLTVSVGGRTVGSADEVNTPGQWLRAGTISVAAGRHEVTLLRGGGSLAPGNGYEGEVGRVVFEPVAARRLTTVPAADARQLCGRAWDWIERVGS
jgi:hypothetical protein